MSICKFEIVKFFSSQTFLPKFASSHLQVPTPFLLESGLIRVYFACRDKLGRSHTSFLELDPSKDFEVTYIHQKSVMGLGEVGTFDVDGVMVNQVIELEQHGLLLLYTGWNQGTDVPYKTMAGLAVSTDGGVSFNRLSKGPLLGIDSRHPYFTNTPFLIKSESGGLNLFYGSGIKWIDVKGKLEPQYQIKSAITTDLKVWKENEEFKLEEKLEFESNVRPWVDIVSGGYKLYYCFRGTQDFRNGFDSYKIAVSESENLITWGKPTEIAFCNNINQLRLSMYAYPALINTQDDRKLLFFNGDSFGRDGFYLAMVGS